MCGQVPPLTLNGKTRDGQEKLGGKCDALIRSSPIWQSLSLQTSIISYVLKYTQTISSFFLMLKGEINGLSKKEVWGHKKEQSRELQNRRSKIWGKVKLLKKKKKKSTRNTLRHENKTNSLPFGQQFKLLFFQAWPLENLSPHSNNTRFSNSGKQKWLNFSSTLTMQGKLLGIKMEEAATNIKIHPKQQHLKN